MTTPTPATRPRPPAPGPPPRPAPARSRWRPAAGLLALLLVAAGTAAAVRWGQGGGDGDPLAGRPRVTDGRAGLSYGVPDGWRHDTAEDGQLIGAFSSRIREVTAGSAETGGTVLAGRAGQTVPRAGLGRATEPAARSNAEFFFPDRPATLAESHATVLDGRPAHTAVLRIDGADGPARLRMTVVTVDGERTSFLLGITTGTAGPAAAGDVEAVLDGATVD